jgi:Tol biopolymer transport system component
MMTGQWNIYSMTLSGKNVRKEIENSVFDSTIDVSKDGRNVAFATIENQDHKVKLLNMASQKVRSTSGD